LNKLYLKWEGLCQERVFASCRLGSDSNGSFPSWEQLELLEQLQPI